MFVFLGKILIRLFLKRTTKSLEIFGGKHSYRKLTGYCEKSPEACPGPFYLIYLEANENEVSLTFNPVETIQDLGFKCEDWTNGRITESKADSNVQLNWKIVRFKQKLSDPISNAPNWKTVLEEWIINKPCLPAEIVFEKPVTS